MGFSFVVERADEHGTPPGFVAEAPSDGSSA
jgi:hypothetical protein